MRFLSSLLSSAPSSIEWDRLDAWPLVLILALVGFTLIFLAWRRESQVQPRCLIAYLLRFATLLLLLAILLGPTRTERLPEPGENEAVVLIDHSASYRSRGDYTRIQELRRGEKSDSAWAEFRDVFQASFYGFGSREGAINLFQTSEDGAEVLTRLHHSIKIAQERAGQRAAAGVIVFTDGIENSPEAGQQELLDQIDSDVPIYFIRPSREAGDYAGDLALRQVSPIYDPFLATNITLMTELAITPARDTGLSELDIQIEVVDSNETQLIKEAITIPAGRDVHAAKLSVPAPDSASAHYTVRLLSADGAPLSDMVVANDSRRVAVNKPVMVHPILYLSGRPNWEYKFMQRVIGDDPELDLSALIRIAKREPQFQWKGRMGETGNPLFRGFQSADGVEQTDFDQPVFVRLNLEDNEGFLTGFPRLAKDLFQPFRAIVIDDLEAAFFTAEQKELLFDFVTERGGSLVLLGGQESFVDGGWSADPLLRRLLPFRELSSQRGDEVKEIDFVRVSDRGERLGWSLPEIVEPSFMSWNRQGAGKLTTRELMGLSEKAGSSLMEIRVGKGKVFTWPIADTWRAQLADKEQRDWFAQFWAQFLRYGVTDVPTGIEVDVAAHAISSNQMALQVKARVSDELFQPDDAAVVKLFATSEGSEESKEFTIPLSLQESGVFEDQNITVAGQVATLQFEVTQKGESSLQPQMVVTNPLADEMSNLEVDEASLRRIAERSGGGVFTWDQFSELFQDLKKQERMKLKETKEPLWQSIWWFVGIAILLLSEWWVRRRRFNLA